MHILREKNHDSKISREKQLSQKNFSQELNIYAEQNNNNVSGVKFHWIA